MYIIIITTTSRDFNSKFLAAIFDEQFKQVKIATIVDRHTPEQHAIKSEENRKK